MTAADVDGDLDVLSASFLDDKIAWYENRYAPVIAAFDAAVTYVENAAALILDANATVTNPNSSSKFNTGTLNIALTANGQTEDRLEIRHQGTGAGQIGVSGVNVSFAGTTIGTFVGGTGTTALVVTLNASATPAAVQALLRDITFRTITEAPVTAARTVRVTLTDGTGLTSNQPTKSINVTAVNDLPTITGFDTAISYTEDGVALLLDSDGTLISVTDPDFATGTMTVSLPVPSNFDILSIRNEGAGAGQIGISGANVTFGGTVIGTFAGGTNATALVITFNASATPVAATALARNLTFRSTNQNPTGVSVTGRIVRIVLTDGDGGSHTASKTLSMVPTNDAATIIFFDTAITYTENGAAQLMDSDITPIVVADVDSTNFDTGTMTVVTNPNSATDVIGIRNEGTGVGQIGISGANVTFGGTLIGAFTGGTNTTPLVIMLNASATPTTITALAKNLTFRSTSDNPSTLQRTASITLTDGDGGTRTVTKKINVVAVNDAPVLAVPGTLNYTENLAASAINLVVTVNDLDNTTLSTATIAITNFVSGQDVLRFTAVPATMGNIVLTSNVNGVMILTSAGRTATRAQWQTALKAVTYSNTSDNPNTTARTVTFVVNDGTANSNTLTNTINITTVADAPFITNFSNAITFTEGGAALLIDTDVTVTDPDTADTGGGVLKVYTNVADSADRLAILHLGNGVGEIGVSGANVSFGGVLIGTFTGGVSTTPLTITLNAAARYASVQALLRRVTFRNTSTTPVTTARTLRVSYHNGLERIVSKTLNVVATIPQPALNNGSSSGQPAAINPLTAGTNSDTKRRRPRHAPDNTAPAALDTASAAQRRANRRRGV